MADRKTQTGRVDDGPDVKLVIAGGGIGGLTLALAARHFGIDVLVLEQAAAPGEIGAGLQLSPNAMHVMGALGLGDAIAERGFAPEAIEMRDGRSGGLIFSIPLGQSAIARWGAPYLHIHRADLVDVLRAGLPADHVRYGAKLAGFDETPGGVTVRLASGETLTGDALAGADGIHSIVREQIAGPDLPRFTGNVAWRAVVPMTALGDLVPPPTACAWVGEGRHAVTYRLRGGAVANFVGVVETDVVSSEAWDAEGAKAEAIKDFAGWHPVIVKLIGSCDTLNRWSLFDRPPLSRWHSDRAVLLGDACHPMLPFLAQGAAMAIEDAWVLAQYLSTAGSPARAFSAFERRRHLRTLRVQGAARANTGLFHRRGKLARAATYGPLWFAGRALPGVVHGSNDWLYGHDVTRR